MGTTTIFNYTILGDCVNLASRLEGVNKEYGTSILIGEETRARLGGECECRELDWIRVQGKERPVAIYELGAIAGGLSARRRELFARFGTGLEYYRNRHWQSASAQFRAALAIDPPDGPSRVFVDRCALYHAAPPPPDWDGVHIMTHK
jgi:adenylate cyclase